MSNKSQKILFKIKKWRKMKRMNSSLAKSREQDKKYKEGYRDVFLT